MQTDGGPIGLRLTGSICKVVMDKWTRQVSKKMEENNLGCELIVKYVDDMDVFLRPIELGVSWEGGKKGKLVHSDLKESNDIQNEKCKSQVTMEAFKDIGESCNNRIKLTIDYEGNHIDSRVPMLNV